MNFELAKPKTLRRLTLTLKFKRTSNFTRKYNKQIHALGGHSTLDDSYTGNGKVRLVRFGFMTEANAFFETAERKQKEEKVFALIMKLIAENELTEAGCFFLQGEFVGEKGEEKRIEFLTLQYKKINNKPITTTCICHALMDMQDLANWGHFFFTMADTDITKA